MRKFMLLMSLLFVTPNLSAAQTAEISGTVLLPAGAKQKATVSRGQAYRGRGGADKAAGKDEESAYEDVIVSVHPTSFKAEVKPLSEPAKIQQENATFVPHVTPITIGSTIHFINQDKFYHNVFSLTPGAKFNVGRKPKGDVVTQKIDKLGEVKLFCDIHTHMNAIILSLDTPYFVRVDKSGGYKLTDLPAGTYEIRVYHPNFTQVTETLTVKDGDKTKKDFAMTN